MSEEKGKHFDEGKPQIHLVPEEVILGMAQVFGMGAAKYGKYNFRSGIEYTRIYDSLQRHMLKFMKREDFDEESGLNHLYHAAANIAMLIYMYENVSEMDDRAPARKAKENVINAKDQEAKPQSSSPFLRNSGK